MNGYASDDGFVEDGDSENESYVDEPSHHDDDDGDDD